MLRYFLNRVTTAMYTREAIEHLFLSDFTSQYPDVEDGVKMMYVYYVHLFVDGDGENAFRTAEPGFGALCRLLKKEG